MGDVTVSNTEFGYLDGVTQGIQGQLNAKQYNLQDSQGHINGSYLGDGNVTNTTLGYLNGVTSPIQSQINNANTTIANLTGPTSTLQTQITNNLKP